MHKPPFIMLLLHTISEDCTILTRLRVDSMRSLCSQYIFHENERYVDDQALLSWKNILSKLHNPQIFVAMD